MFRNGARLTLVFDADDTLWDSNIHFLEAFEDFASNIVARGLESNRDRIRRVMSDVELDLIKTLGYGRRPYVAALHRAAREIAAEFHNEELTAAIERIGERLLGRRCELLPDVAETIPELSDRNTLILFTKGQRDEQLEKLQLSGLAPYFSRVETPREKDVDAYRRLIADAGLKPAQSFMVGNSPRSDINPAVRAGFRAAVYVPYPHTWEFEHDEIDPTDPRIVKIETFRRLREMF
ncbi:MAG TPA: HAD family hydrolase [Candidatus Binataceae bacterium]|nr:HAD family hydrolase [Candidatus Binataceae bacterium]